MSGGVLSISIDPGVAVMNIIEADGGPGSVLNITGTVFLPKIYYEDMDASSSWVLNVIQENGDDTIYMSDCVIKFDASSFDILDNDSQLVVGQSNIYFDNVSYEFRRAGGLPSFTAVGLEAHFKGKSFVGCKLLGGQPDFLCKTQVLDGGQVSGNRISGDLMIGTQVQVNGNYIDGDVNLNAAGTDTVVIGNHVTGTISGSVEVNEFNTN